MFNTISKPEFGIDKILHNIDSRTSKKSESVKAVLQPDVQVLLKEAESKYIYLASDYYKIKPQETLRDLTDKQAINVFTNRFRKTLSNQYEKLLHVRVCPICGASTPSTIEHVLPKTSYVQYVLTPINLVPMCLNCNHAKLDASIKSYETTPFHPYFDDFCQLPGMSYKIVDDDFSPIAIEYKDDESISFRKFKYDMKLYKMDETIEGRANDTVRKIYERIKQINSGKIEKQDFKAVIEDYTDEMFLDVWEKRLYEFLLDNIDEFWKHIDAFS
jgi:5-methylcytosine-specific restriction endonuclease McrA